jgi:hypothetical protein
LLVVLAGLSYTRLAGMNGEMGALVHLRYANTVSANAIKADVNEATRGMLSVLVMTDPEQVRKELAEDLVKAFMDGIDDNLDKAEKAKIVGQIGKFGEMFAGAVKKGGVMHMDWIPATGTGCELNGKRIGDALPDLNFHHAVLRICLGDRRSTAR